MSEQLPPVGDDLSDDGQSSGSTGASPHAAGGPEQDDTLAVLEGVVA